MVLRKDILFAITLISALFQTPTVSAEILPSQSPVNIIYDFKTDPFLFSWTFKVKKEEAVSVLTEAEQKELLLLEQWKTKQTHLWKNLSKEKFIINASAYTASSDECGKSDGITASGLKVKESRTLACPPSYPFGTKIAIEGIGVLRCEDRGGAIKGNHFDIYMETKNEAFAFGRRNLSAEIVD